MLWSVMIGLSAMATGSAAQEETASQAMAERYQAEFADCVVRRKNYAAPVATFLRAIPDTPGWGEAGLKAADLSCLNAAAKRTESKITMKMQPSSFRDAIYPALYRQQFARAPQTARIGALPPLDIASEFDGDIASLPAEYRPRRALGDCVARTNPTEAHKMLLAGPGSKSETAAVESLKPSIAGCLPAGTSIRMNRPALRAHLGEAMYKLSRAASSAG
ncbi:hypothetical protein [Sphingomonas yantingensis]|uniref:Uncharacterized protein n=1 Tax=Sphingomonas yantingensis TaxID=1241761 RepID=A0A7W9EJC8_9SPHN|nr:hypothetical protein [Sphingomonas yantingensis]MBB5698925.1 hypothetical protein [Sphingomonas yantingensis]